jgi:acetylornithine deacetylase/succinyl-diaminopimelate desuccinylase-like protein
MRIGKNESGRALAVFLLLLGSTAGTADPDAVAQRLGEAVRFRTISHQDPAADDRAAFAGFREFLERTYSRLHATLRKELVNEDALLHTWEGSDDTRPPILFMAHYDVVPVEPGTEAEWTRDPFGGEIADGYVWRRGTIDDKGSLVMLCEAVEALVAEGFRPAATLYLAFGHDEEVGGRRGAQARRLDRLRPRARPRRRRRRTDRDPSDRADDVGALADFERRVPTWAHLVATIHELFPDAVVAPGLVLGGTDSRHFGVIADDVYRFIPVRLGPGDLERFHGTDEPIAVADLEAGVGFYRRLLLAEGAPASVP